MPRAAAVAGAVLLGALALTGCTAPTTDTAAATSTDAASQSPTPTAAATAAPVIDLPDCGTVVPEDYDATFLHVPLNARELFAEGPLGAFAPTPAAAGATNDETIEAATELRCIWKDPRSDVSFLSLEAARVPAEAAVDRFDGLAADGYTCTDLLKGRQCQLVGTNAQYPVEEADTQFFRDDVLIRIQQANAPTSGLMAAVVGGIWG